MKSLSCVLVLCFAIVAPALGTTYFGIVHLNGDPLSLVIETEELVISGALLYHGSILEVSGQLSDTRDGQTAEVEIRTGQGDRLATLLLAEPLLTIFGIPLPTPSSDPWALTVIGGSMVDGTGFSGSGTLNKWR